MAALKLTPNPTWVGKVSIPTPEGFLELELEFKHRARSEIQGFFEAMKEKNAAQGVMSCAIGWKNVEEPWNEENVGKFLDNYFAADRIIIKEYVDQLTQQRVGN